ncbi:uncharacterized protein LOC126378398 [Pectinophora gossypiella]|uniref:uncharacterized protein LOC126378398 n=1 Tax=Pectinophora gossypiella TaxID=13191 RepID=UPI00214EFA92|nr:uncharacterized protein LOC126378398 [Pectinophora gossypiella]
MVEPAKPFACTLPDCGMSFTNEDHLHVHIKKHDMVLQLGLVEQKAAFVADQTPTPTRFIRNCEEVGLFQDLQNVAANPFDEGFKRAMEAKQGILSLESTMGNTDDVLHTPQMFPLLDSAESTLFTNNQRNTTISRSSSDESGTIKEFETRTISKLTNEVITISRIVNNTQNGDISVKQTDIATKIESNIVRKDTDGSKPVLVYTDTVTKDTAQVNKDIVIDNNKLYVDKVPIMSQKSIDFVVDSLTSDLGATVNHTVIDGNDKKRQESKIEAKINITTQSPSKDAKLAKRFVVQPKILPKDVKPEPETGDYEVIIKLPNGKHVKMKPVDEKPDAKVCLRNSIAKRTVKNTPTKLPIIVKKTVPNVVKIPSGTLIPVTLVDQQGTPLSNDDLNKVPITKIGDVKDITTLTKIPVNVAKNANASNIIKINAKSVNRPTTGIKASITPLPDSCNIKVSQPYQIDKETGKRKLAPTTPTNQEEIEKRIQGDCIENNDDDDCVIDNVSQSPEMVKRTRLELESRCAASRRYRERLKDAMKKQTEENRLLREANERLIAEKSVLKLLITEHMKRCPNAADIVDRLNVLTHGQML